MRIMVNTRLLLRDRLEGIGVFTHEILQRLVRSHPEHEFLFVFDRTPDPEFLYSSNVKGITSFPPSRHPILWKWWINRTFPAMIKKWAPDVFLSTDGFIPLPCNVPVVNVIHDINFEYHPEFLPPGVLRFYRKFFPEFAQNSDQLITVSQYSANTLHEKYNLKNKKILIAHNAANEAFHPIDSNAKTLAREYFSKKHPYFLFVGSLNPRKNLNRLLQAFELFCQQSSTETHLLIAGSEMHGTKENALLAACAFKDRIHFLGRVPEAELPLLYAGALAVVYVPLFEGFGIPVIEAMQCGTPVITSNVTSLPEVAGDAAILVNPYDPAEISQAMIALAMDPQKQQQMREDGIKNAKRFSWEASSELIWKAIQDATQRK